MNKTALTVDFVMGAVPGAAFGFYLLTRGVWRMSESWLPLMLHLAIGSVIGGVTAALLSERFWEWLQDALGCIWVDSVRLTVLLGSVALIVFLVVLAASRGPE